MRMLFVFVLLAVIGPVTTLRAQSVADGIVVIVNDAIITHKEVQDFVGPAVDLLIRQYQRQPEVLRQKVGEAEREGLEQLVERQLILHDYTISGYSLPESVIEDEIQHRVREQFGDRATLTRTLQAQGTTYESYRKQVRDQFIVSILRQKNISSEIIISPFKIETYYQAHKADYKVEDQVKLRMIVINQPSGAAPDTAQKLAREVLLKLDEGVSFKEMASIYSEGSQRGEGGDWGWVERSVLRKELAEVAFTLKPGERSGVIVTPTACYVMLVEDVRKANVKPLAEVRSEVEKILITKEQARLQKKYIDRLKTKSFIRYF
ncbi:MAG: peptidyl-prolyl cis-trans isomerase [Pedosphaera parvula]|nr:peptidyl-prolyl cis-trans isomerase [Pedosphaera parvula]